MSTFQHRLTRTAEAYKGLQQPGGGWGENPWIGSPTSIVNTVEVLAVLRAAGVPYQDEAVRDALGYLFKAVVEHPQPIRGHRNGEQEARPLAALAPSARDSQEARGEYSRYCAWGIAGLTLFKASRHDPELLDAQDHCVRWLAEHECRGQGAWGETPESEHPSLVSTSAAVTGLSRVCAYTRAGRNAQELVLRARAVIRQLAHETDGARPKAHWSLSADAASARGSASATAMAVIALSGGTAADQDYALKGAEWLLAHRGLWENQVESDGSVPDADWRHMAFSLGLRAIIRGTRQPPGNALRPALRYLDSLWHEDKQQWSHGRPKAEPSPSGAYAVVAAYEALANAWSFDANREVLGEKPRDDHTQISQEVLLRVGGSGATRVSDLDGSEITVSLTPVQHQMMHLLTERWLKGAKIEALDAKSWDVLELAEAIQHGVEVSTVERYVREINRLFHDVALSQGKSIGTVVQLQKSSTSPARRRAVIVVGNAEITD